MTFIFLSSFIWSTFRICQAAVKQLQDIFDQTDMFVDCEIVDTLLVNILHTCTSIALFDIFV